MNLNENVDLIEKNVTFIIFSTNSKKLSFELLTGIYLSKESPIIINFDDKIIKFKKKINESNILFNFVNFTLSNITIPFSIFLNAEFLIVFIDLEFEKSFSNLENLMNYIKSKKIQLKNKILIYGIYNNIDSIQENMTEKNLGDYFDSESIFFEYYKLDFNNIDSIVESYNFFMNEATQNSLSSNNENDEIQFNESNYSCCYLY